MEQAPAAASRFFHPLAQYPLPTHSTHTHRTHLHALKAEKAGKTHPALAVATVDGHAPFPPSAADTVYAPPAGSLLGNVFRVGRSGRGRGARPFAGGGGGGGGGSPGRRALDTLGVAIAVVLAPLLRVAEDGVRLRVRNGGAMQQTREVGSYARIISYDGSKGRRQRCVPLLQVSVRRKKGHPPVYENRCWGSRQTSLR